MDQPTLRLDANRSLALDIGVTESMIADNVLATLSGSGQTAPTYWLDPSTALRIWSMSRRRRTRWRASTPCEGFPISNTVGIGPTAQPELVGGLASVSMTSIPGVVSHAEIMPVIDIYANAAGRDLGAVAGAIRAVIDEMRSELARGASVALIGQATTMRSAYTELLAGLALSIVLVFLVIVVNFQSWLDPLVVVSRCRPL